MSGIGKSTYQSKTRYRPCCVRVRSMRTPVQAERLTQRSCPVRSPLWLLVSYVENRALWPCILNGFWPSPFESNLFGNFRSPLRAVCLFNLVLLRYDCLTRRNAFQAVSDWFLGGGEVSVHCPASGAGRCWAVTWHAREFGRECQNK